LVQLFLTQLAIKRLFKFPPHPTHASALPGEIKTHKIGVKINKKRQKTIRDITDSILEKDNEILIVFGINTFDITGHQMAIQIPGNCRLLLHYLGSGETERMQQEIKQKEKHQ